MHTIKFIPDHDHKLYENLEITRKLTLKLKNTVCWFGIVNVKKKKALIKEVRAETHSTIMLFREYFPEYDKYEVKIGTYYIIAHQVEWCIDIRIPML